MTEGRLLTRGAVSLSHGLATAAYEGRGTRDLLHSRHRHVGALIHSASRVLARSGTPKYRS